MVLSVVDEAERRDAARLQAKIFLHASLRSKGQLALVKPLLQVVDVHLVHTLEDDKIMPIALMVPEKQVLAVCRVKLFPVFDGRFNGRNRRMKIDVELDA